MSSNYITNRETDAFLEVQMLDEMNSDNWSLIHLVTSSPFIPDVFGGLFGSAACTDTLSVLTTRAEHGEILFYYIKMKFRPSTVSWWIKWTIWLSAHWLWCLLSAQRSLILFLLIVFHQPQTRRRCWKDWHTEAN